MALRRASLRSSRKKRKALFSIAPIALVTALAAQLAVTPLFQELDKASANAPTPNPLASIDLAVDYDGTGHGTPSQTFVNSTNGYTPGDDSPNDGVVASGDLVGVTATITIEAGLARSIEVRALDSSLMKFDADSWTDLCVDTPGVDAEFLYDKCVFNVQSGVTAQYARSFAVVAGDSKGQATSETIALTIGIEDRAVYSTAESDEITIVSAPAADLTLDTENYYYWRDAFPSSLPITIEPKPLLMPGYNTYKGASIDTPWSAELDVSELLANSTSPSSLRVWNGTEYIYPVNGKVALSGSGMMRGNISGFSPKIMVSGERKYYYVNLIVAPDAFSTSDFLNNGDGTQPGTGQGYSYSTSNYGRGATNGRYPAVNNDWTSIWVHERDAASYGTGVIVGTRIPRASAPDTIFDPKNKFWDQADRIDRVLQANTAVPAGAEIQFTTGANLSALSSNSGIELETNWCYYSNVVSVDTARQSVVHVNGYVDVLDPSLYTIEYGNYNGSIWTSTPDANTCRTRAVLDTSLGYGSSAMFNTAYSATPIKVKDTGPQYTAFNYTGSYKNGGFFVNSSTVWTVNVKWPAPTTVMAYNVADKTTVNTGERVNYTLDAFLRSANTIYTPQSASYRVDFDRCMIDPKHKLGNSDNPWGQWQATYVDAIPGDTGRVCGDPTSTPGYAIFTITDTALSEYGKYISATVGWYPGFRGLQVSAQIANNAPAGSMQLKVTQQYSQAVDAVETYVPVAVSKQQITSSAVLADRKYLQKDDGSAKMQARFSTTAAVGDTARTVVALPQLGDGIYYNQLTNTEDYDLANESSFEDYLIEKLSLNLEDTTVGGKLYMTTDTLPSLDPYNPSTTWIEVNATTDMTNVTAVMIETQGTGELITGRVDFWFAPTWNSNDVFLLWMGETVIKDSADVTRQGAPMPWPGETRLSSMNVSGHFVWDPSGKHDGTEGIEGLTLELIDGETVLATAVTDENGFFDFADVDHYFKTSYLGTYPDTDYFNIVVADWGSNGEALVSYYNQESPYVLSVKNDPNDATDDWINITDNDITFGYDITKRTEAETTVYAYAKNPLVDIDLNPSFVTCGPVECDLSWTGKFDTNGNVILDGGKLTSVLDQDIFDVKAEIENYSTSTVVDYRGYSNGYTFLTDEGNIYRLGDWPGGGSDTPKKIFDIPELEGQFVKLVKYAGLNWSYQANLGITNDGSLWFNGEGNRLDYGYTPDSEAAKLWDGPTQGKIIDFAASKDSIHFLTEDGSLYYAGSNQSSSGIDSASFINSSDFLMQKVTIPNDEPIVKITPGDVYSHSVAAITSEGNYIAIGYASQFVPGSSQSFTTATRVDTGTDKIIDAVYVTWEYHLALTEDNEVYFSSNNVRDDFGIVLSGKLKDADGNPIKVKSLVKNLADKNYNSSKSSLRSWDNGADPDDRNYPLFIGEDGKLYTISNQELEYGETIDDIVLQPINAPNVIFDEVYIINEDASSNELYLAMTEDREAYLWSPEYDTLSVKSVEPGYEQLPTKPERFEPLDGFTSIVYSDEFNTLTFTGKSGKLNSMALAETGSNYKEEYLLETLDESDVADASLAFPADKKWSGSGYDYVYIVSSPSAGTKTIVPAGYTGYSSGEGREPLYVPSQGGIFPVLFSDFKIKLAQWNRPQLAGKNGDLVSRTWTVTGLPEESDQLGYTITAKVMRSTVNEIFAQQIYYSSPLTPIASLQTDGRTSPLSATAPTVANLDPVGIANNLSCNTDADVNGQTPIDMCDQVPFAIPAATGPVAGVQGVVLDETGAPVASIPVKLTMGEQVREVLTDSSGEYSFTGLPSGEATVEVLASGVLVPSKANAVYQFAPTQPGGILDPATGAATITVNAGELSLIDVTLAEAASQLNVTVNSTAGSPAVLELDRTTGLSEAVTVTWTIENVSPEALNDFSPSLTAELGDPLSNFACTINGVPLEAFATLGANETVICEAVFPSQSASVTHRTSLEVTSVGASSGFIVTAESPWSATVDGSTTWSIDKTVTPELSKKLRENDTASVTLRVVNTGTVDLAGVKVVEDISELLTYATLDPLPAGLTLVGNTLEWDLSLVPYGEAASITYSFTSTTASDTGGQFQVTTTSTGGFTPANSCSVDEPCVTTHSLASAFDVIVLPVLGNPLFWMTILLVLALMAAAVVVNQRKRRELQTVALEVTHGK